MACGAAIPLKRPLDLEPRSGLSPKRRRCGSGGAASPGQPRKYLSLEPSPFGEVTPRLSSEQILESIRREFRRLQRRRHLEVSGSGAGRDGLSSTRETGLLTARQVAMICERALKEREEGLREEYNRLLTEKLNEQYDTFVKFSHDQILCCFGEKAPTYVS
uniref:Akirin 2 n=1 Tax=Eptatretus burgeri TaxID=7764 RepID=A0A8C4PZZ9_EPTBU